MTPELCFVSAVGDSVFMDELLEVVADAVRRAGGRARTVTGRYPDAGPDTVYVVVPHEYFAVTPEADRPSAEQCGRTIAFCVEHPGTATFERTASLLPELGAAVDINVDSTAELRARGGAVEHFQLGYSPLWDRWGGDPDHPRDVDVTYLGTAERRRSALLRDYAADLDHLRVRLLTPPHEPMGPARVDFLPGRAKHEHLAGSRLILNLHRERSTALEWVRVLEAICNGCVVVTETSVDVAPLVPGDHLVMARAESLGAVAAALAGQPDREHKLRTAAYEFVRSTLDMRESAQVLIGLATDLLARTSTPAPVLSAAPAEPETTGERPLAVDTPSWDPRFAGVRSLGREVSDADRAAATLAVAATVAARRDGVRQWQPTAAAALFDDRPR
ncbi:MAG TPA: glycosyltransferase, partial [Pseudonocardiaceae bacterium]|nr:glycosyltransferase [Pseudonocardiaceae bacterium]